MDLCYSVRMCITGYNRKAGTLHRNLLFKSLVPALPFVDRRGQDILVSWDKIVGTLYPLFRQWPVENPLTPE